MIYRMRAAVRRSRKGLVLCLFLALHLAVSKADNRVLLVGSTDPVRGIVGGDVILPCFLRPTTSAVEESVEWQRPVLEPKEVHLYRDRSDDNVIQYPSYSGRTSLFREELKNGNVSLKLTNVKLSDAGNYTCYIPTLGHQKTTIELYVGEDGTPSSSFQPTQPPLKDQSGKVRGAAPRPWLSIVRTKDKEVVLKCVAEGLVYKPELVLLNSKGTILPADEPTERPMDSEGLYTVTRYFTVQKTATNVFTCQVQQLEIKHMRETQIHVPDKMFHEEAEDLGWKIGFGIGCVVGGVVVGVIVFLFMRKNNPNNALKQHPEEKERNQ
ncbi:butyrophilin subfamily 1 member A1 isoform X1 [Oncorhynchus kisutch]|uniref:butyrophilin subfamily 1 member A1 isoform X1 n=1 Tax=Oncorhynchus kisutch TaxID=8019 RepID=UPI0009A08C5E|nr:butyrophilin subfamily 1 member A1 isoform X1 [Oncorhynchus kisutch]XP_031649861.1 butyrophilin subfamily 1 member A1 isoform X1 [Oncorhynchus kisutch]